MVNQTQKTNGLLSDYIFHPGDTLNEVLGDRNMTQSELALRTGVSNKHISTIISGKKDISVSFAKKLEYALSINASFWLNLQTKYDQEMYEYKEANLVSKEEIKIIKEQLKEVVKDFETNGWISKKDSDIDLVIEFRRILCVSDLTNLKSISYASAYRIHEGINPYVLMAWQRMCELKNEDEFEEKKLDVQKLKKNIDTIKETMFLNQNLMYKRLKEIFKECGIVFDIVKNYKGAPVQGYLKNINGQLLLCMILRGKYMDIFWFTLFHEIGHIVNGDINNCYIDLNNEDNSKEQKADFFSRNALIQDKDYNDFIYNYNYRDIYKIRELSRKNKIHESIIIGRLMKDGFVDYSEFGKYRKQYNFM